MLNIIAQVSDVALGPLDEDFAFFFFSVHPSEVENACCLIRKIICEKKKTTSVVFKKSKFFSLNGIEC